MESFDLIAKEYDTDTRIKRSKIIADKTRSYIKNGSAKSAIEYGCGTGLVGLQLANEFRKLLLVDSSSEMIAQVEKKLSSMDKPNVSTLCADFIETMPPDGHIDYIFSSLVLHHIKDTKSIMRCFYDLLCDTGCLLVIDIDTDDGGFHAKHHGFDGHNGFNQSSLIDLAKKVGFSEAKTETFYYDSKSENGKEQPYSLFILNAMK